MATGRKARLLILVKTYPVPSQAHNEIVCTAALDESTGKLVRIFPLPFRTLAEAGRFKKWGWVEATIYPGKDGRLDSFKIDASTIAVVGHEPAGKNWPRRWSLISHLVSPSLEGLEANRVAGGATLGLIKPAEFTLEIENAAGSWAADEIAKLQRAEGSVDLFGAAVAPSTLLEKMPVNFRYRYRCDDARCKGHDQKFEDWEVCQAYRDWRRKYDGDKLRAALINKFAEEPRRKDNLYLFVGTMAQHQGSWLVIGQIRPELATRGGSKATSGPPRHA